MRVCVNAYGNLYWMYTLYRGIAAARRKQFASHRRWMLRNFSVAVAIIFGRYVGTSSPHPPSPFPPFNTEYISMNAAASQGP